MSNVSPAGMATLQSMAVTGSAYLTAENGQELIAAGLITVDATKPSSENPQAFLCELTEAGIGMLTAPAAPAAPASPFPAAPEAPAASAPPAAPVVPAVMEEFTIRQDIAVPTIKRGGGSTGPRAEKYPFSKLEIGQSFHVKPGKDIDKTARTISTKVSNANNASKVPANPPQVETVTKHRYKKDEAGNFVKGENGKKVRESYQVEQQKMTQTKFFVSRKVDENDPEGVGIRVFRVSEE